MKNIVFFILTFLVFILFFNILKQWHFQPKLEPSTRSSMEFSPPWLRSACGSSSRHLIRVSRNGSSKNPLLEQIQVSISEFPKIPYRTIISSFTGLGFRPMPPHKNVESTLIWYKGTDLENYKTWTDELNEFLKGRLTLFRVTSTELTIKSYTPSNVFRLFFHWRHHSFMFRLFFSLQFCSLCNVIAALS